MRQFKWAFSSRQIFEWQKITRPEALTDIQRAARFFYLQHHAFGGKVTGQTFGTTTTGPAINLLRIEKSLSAAWQRLAGTYVENLSWLACAELYDQAHTFFYMAPLTGRPPAMVSTSPSRSISAWPTSYAGARVR
ncbi:DNA adenine methylase [Pseudomonas sp. CC120222-01a]|nr:DNA adenine methylase [Pseudomonas sp. CC120222-01a]